MALDATTLDELFRALDLSLTVRASNEEPDAWACTLIRPDGATFEIESVSFFDVDPDTGDEWVVEPTPSRVLGVLAGGEVETDDEDGAGAAEETSEAAKAFLGDEAFALLMRLDVESLD